jgi:hypothetical protein
MFIIVYAQSHAERRYAECRYAKCRFVECWGARRFSVANGGEENTI